MMPSSSFSSSIAVVVAVLSVILPQVRCIGGGLAPQMCGNGNGIAYHDTDVCECFNCFEGPNCEHVSGRCAVVATGGNPLLMQDFWIDLGVAGSFPGNVDIEPYYRVGYQHTPAAARGDYGPGSLRLALEDQVRMLHARFGNAETKGRRVVFGAGATTLIAASQVAYARVLASRTAAGKVPRKEGTDTGPLLVYAEPPHYNGYPDFASLGTLGMTFTGNASLAAENAHRTVQFSTSPNNPTGEDRNCSLWTSGGQGNPGDNNKPLGCVYDRVYYWPSLTQIGTTSAPGEVEGVTLFSLSKLSGHASTRVGWALVSDDAVADAMEAYISTAQIEVSSVSLYRTLSILRALNSHVGDDFMTFIKATLVDRWSAVLKALSGSTKFTVSSVPDQFYLWLRCNNLDIYSSCFELFKAGGIVGEPGSSFGAGPEFIRIELMQHLTVWPDFIKNFQAIVVS